MRGFYHCEFVSDKSGIYNPLPYQSWQRTNYGGTLSGAFDFLNTEHERPDG